MLTTCCQSRLVPLLSRGCSIKVVAVLDVARDWRECNACRRVKVGLEMAVYLTYSKEPSNRPGRLDVIF